MARQAMGNGERLFEISQFTWCIGQTLPATLYIDSPLDCCLCLLLVRYNISISNTIVARYLYIYTISHPHPISDRCHLQQPTGYHTVLVGLPYPPYIRQTE